ncbi:MAG: hypothetical protein RLZZ494_303, partial [Pseudomonadota bacterium]
MAACTRRHWLTWAGGGGGAAVVVGNGPSAHAGEHLKVLRYALRVAETTFDPVQVQDVYSAIPLEHMLEGLYTYDHLARPVRLKPLTAAGMPEVSADFRVFTIRVRPGIFFADDPVFRGQPRELVAADYVYSIKRYADPVNKSPNWSSVDELGIVGLAELRAQALQQRRALAYDHDIPGLRALDRYTLRITLREPRPRLVQKLVGGFVAVAREVIDGYPGRSGEHPVGTGPFRLAAWRRSSHIVLERNPRYREHVYDAEPAADDAEGQALLARFKGRRLPMIDRVELSVIEENQPRWLSFLDGSHDLIAHVPEAFISAALPGGR